MTPTEFEFTVTMPGDARLLGAIRQLTAHAAGYARLTTEAGEALAGHVERATATALSAATLDSASIEYHFRGNGDAVVVVFSCDVRAATPEPASVSTDGLTIEWASDGSRHVCRIRQSLSGA